MEDPNEDAVAYAAVRYVMAVAYVILGVVAAVSLFRIWANSQKRWQKTFYFFLVLGCLGTQRSLSKLYCNRNAQYERHSGCFSRPSARKTSTSPTVSTASLTCSRRTCS